MRPPKGFSNNLNGTGLIKGKEVRGTWFRKHKSCLGPTQVRQTAPREPPFGFSNLLASVVIHAELNSAYPTLKSGNPPNAIASPQRFCFTASSEGAISGGQQREVNSRLRPQNAALARERASRQRLNFISNHKIA